MEIKVPFYNILNMFLTGLVFIGGCLVIFPDTAVALFNSDIIENLGAGPEIVVTVCTFAVAYEVGLIINRTGSVVLEPLLKRTKLIPFNDMEISYIPKVLPEIFCMELLSRTYCRKLLQFRRYMEYLHP